MSLEIADSNAKVLVSLSPEEYERAMSLLAGLLRTLQAHDQLTQRATLERVKQVVGAVRTHSEAWSAINDLLADPPVSHGESPLPPPDA